MITKTIPLDRAALDLICRALAYYQGATFKDDDSVRPEPMTPEEHSASIALRSKLQCKLARMLMAKLPAKQQAKLDYRDGESHEHNPFNPITHTNDFNDYAAEMHRLISEENRSWTK